MSQLHDQSEQERPWYERVIVNPDSHELSSAFNSALAVANREASRFKLNSKKFIKEFVRLVLESPEGVEKRSQAGTGRRNYAAVSVAWFTDDLVRKHVRIAGCRVDWSRNVGFRMPAGHPVLAVYPTIQGQYLDGNKVFTMTCDLCDKWYRWGDGMWAGTNCMLCYEAERYFEDTGFYNAVGKVGWC